MKKVLITLLSAIALVSMADTNTVAKAMDSTQYIVYTHAGTGRIVELPEPGKTNFLDRGAVAVLSNGTVLELNPNRINAPKLADTIWVTIQGKEYSMARPEPGRTRKFHSRGRIYEIDHNGGVKQLPDKTRPIGAQAMAQARSMPRPATNSLERLPTRRLAQLLELHKLAAKTNAASAEKVIKIEEIMEARTNKQSKASGIVTADKVEVALPADATFGEPDPPGMDHAYYHGNTRPPLPGDEGPRARLRRLRKKAQ